MKRPSGPPTPGPSRGRRTIVLNIAVGVFILAAIFGAAGSLRWPLFWIFLGSYNVATTVFMLWLKKHNPDLLKERMSNKPGAKGWDKIIIRAYTVLLVAMMIVAALDAVRFRWSRVPPILQGIAAAGIAASSVVIFWAFRENAFLSGVVRIQTDRGHAVCSTGPYRIVRHPMYLAIVLALLGVPVFLGSLWALIPGALAAGVFVLRTSLEDRALRNELPGYAEYAAAVRWKLVPHVW
jgi:protein-S-isoprenylcysteine O-methyltransferase Ste14